MTAKLDKIHEMYFSLHREKGKEKNHGLSDEEREGQFSKQRDENNPDHVRYKELDMKKTDCAVAMMRRAWKAGLRAAYALCDSWFTIEEFIHAVRSIGDGSAQKGQSPLCDLDKM